MESYTLVYSEVWDSYSPLFPDILSHFRSRRCLFPLCNWE